VLGWSTLTWDEFVQALRTFGARSAGERVYRQSLERLNGRVWAETDADAAAADIVWFLNRWACRLPTAATTEAIAAWLREHGGEVDEHLDSDILDPRIARRERTYTGLYDSLLALKERGVRNMGDAAASKALHQLQPELFVMWDKSIKPHEPVYGAFLVQMHRLAVRLHEQAPADARADLGGYLSRELGYPARKPLAKFLDEYNVLAAAGA
jgi:hypothetical protein